jgi:ERCC4-type nuclease
MEIVCDDRERGVISELVKLQKKSGIKISVSRVKTGDFTIVGQDGTILANIERKTWKDLAASIKDGRTKNLQKQLQLREKTGCMVYYLIEGIAFPGKKSFGRIKAKYLEAHLDHVMIRDNIHVIRSRDIEGTAGRLIQLANNFVSLLAKTKRKTGGRRSKPATKPVEEEEEEEDSESESYSEDSDSDSEEPSEDESDEFDEDFQPGAKLSLGDLEKRFRLLAKEHIKEQIEGKETPGGECTPGESTICTPSESTIVALNETEVCENIKTYLLKSLPGIGEVSADKLLADKLTLPKLCVDPDLVDCSLLGKVAKEKLKKQLVNLGRNQKLKKKILGRFPGIGPSTAEALIKQVDFRELMAGAIPLSDLSEIICGKKKLGMARAKKILVCIADNDN